MADAYIRNLYTQDARRRRWERIRNGIAIIATGIIFGAMIGLLALRGGI